MHIFRKAVSGALIALLMVAEAVVPIAVVFAAGESDDASVESTESTQDSEADDATDSEESSSNESDDSKDTDETTDDETGEGEETHDEDQSAQAEDTESEDQDTTETANDESDGTDESESDEEEETVEDADESDTDETTDEENEEEVTDETETTSSDTDETDSSGSDEEDETTPESDNQTESLTTTEEGDNGGNDDETSALAATTTATSTTEALMQTASSTATTTATSTEPADGPTIVSGKAIALANILNMVNTNFLNSDGAVLFSNFYDMVNGSIDFRNYLSENGYACSLSSCMEDSVQFNVANDATIKNALMVYANSGGNEIDTDGTGTIETGDAYAGLNLINVANTNIVDSNYLLVTMNAFNNVNGDVVFPSLSSFFNSLRSGSSADDITLTNTGDVANDVSVSADAGGNTTNETGDSSITTGDAHGSSNVFNQINSSLIGQESVSIVFRVHGNWAGEVFGAPSDLVWVTDANGGISLFNTESGSGNGSNTNITGENNALIHNDVSVVALTGDNHIENAESAVIATGDAYAGANIINIANANVIGRNWILAVVNIFGDFNGNIAFGRPDLWVGSQAAIPGTLQNGSEVTYTLTVINNGDSEATNVKLTESYDADHLVIVESSVAYTEDGSGALLWEIGTLPPGSATEITYRARIKQTEEGTSITNNSSVLLRETDNNNDDNSDTVTISTSVHRSGSSSRDREDEEEDEERVVTADRALLDVTRVTKELTLSPTEYVAQQVIKITNNNKTVIKNAVLKDVLYDPYGNVIQEEVWQLGDILAGEEIEIGYQTVFKQSAIPGTYTLSSSIAAANLRDTHFGGNGTIVLEAVHKEVAETPKPAVFGWASERPEEVEEEDTDETIALYANTMIPRVEAAQTTHSASVADARSTFRDILYMFFFIIIFSGPILGFHIWWKTIRA